MPAGRPPVPNIRRERVTALFTAEEKRRVDEAARARGRSSSWYVHEVVLAHIENSRNCESAA